MAAIPTACACVQPAKLETNWKLYAEVEMETLHTPHVHSRSIGKQLVDAIEPQGQWVGVFHRSPQAVALAPGRYDMGFPFAPDTYGEGRDGTHFCVIFSGFFIVTAPDCMWWVQKTPLDPICMEVDVGYFFPESIIDTSEFKEKRPRYFERLDQVIHEDDQIVKYQQRGLNDRVAGRYTTQEQVVHSLDKRLINVTLQDDFQPSPVTR